MSEIKLNRRYPDSKPEDITDAYMRGFEVGLAMRADESAELRELVRDIWSAYHDGATNREFRALPDRMRELGVDV